MCNLFWNIKTRYEFGYLELLRVSPRFGVLLGAMVLSVCFILLDILAVTQVINGKGLPDGINPFWKLAFVFKCLTDTIVLDDFKTALDRLKQHKLQLLGGAITDENPQDFVDRDQAQRKKSDPFSNGKLTHPSAYAYPARDWTKAEHSENIDLESALRSKYFETCDCRMGTHLSTETSSLMVVIANLLLYHVQWTPHRLKRFQSEPLQSPIFSNGAHQA